MGLRPLLIASWGVGFSSGLVMEKTPTARHGDTDDAESGCPVAQPLACLADTRPPGYESTMEALCPKEFAKRATKAVDPVCPTQTYEQSTRASQEQTVINEEIAEAHRAKHAADKAKIDAAEAAKHKAASETARMTSAQAAGIGQREPWPWPEYADMRNCPVFFQTAPGLGSQSAVRQRNVEEMETFDPLVKVMGAVFYMRDFVGVVEKLFANLKIPVCYYNDDVCAKANTGGQFSRWATLIMATAYQRKFKLPCMILMEDDVTLHPDFRTGLVKKPLLPLNNPSILRFSAWGEGYVFNLQGVEAFHERMYQMGITSPTDQWLNKHMKDIIEEKHVVKLSVKVLGNKGNILRSSCPSATSFQYTSTRNPRSFLPLLDSFTSEGELDLAKVAWRFANCTGQRDA